MHYLFASDGSESSEKAFNCLLKIVKPQDKVWVLSCYQPATELLVGLLDTAEDLPIINRDEYLKENDFRRSNAQSIVESYITRLKLQKDVQPDSVNGEVRLANDVRLEIINFSKEKEIGIIVMGTRGLGALARSI